MSVETNTTYDVLRALHNRLASLHLMASAQRVTSQARDMCLAVQERRRHSDFFYRLARRATMFPRMRRFLPLFGGDGDPLQIKQEERPEGMVARLFGEVDLANVERLQAALRPALSNCRNIILDISALKYIDSTGLHVLIDTHKVLQQYDCQLIVVGASAGIAKVMRILHLDALMPLVSSVDEAMTLLLPESSEAASNG